MPKRFTATEIWDEDWFLELPMDYRLFWFYIKDKCDRAGIWKPNIRYLNAVCGISLDLDKALKLLNKDKTRIIVLEGGSWFLVDFITFQYGKLRNNNAPHKSILNILKEYNITDIYSASDDDIAKNEDRMKVFKLHKGKCIYCEKKMYINNFVIDHIHPRSKGGGNHISNLALSCISCNSSKRDLSLEEFCNIKKMNYAEVMERLSKVNG